MSLHSSLKLRLLSQLAEVQNPEPTTRALLPRTKPAGHGRPLLPTRERSHDPANVTVHLHPKAALGQAVSSGTAPATPLRLQDA